MIRPNVDLNLKVAAVAPDGTFAAYCGMWYDPEAGYAVIEPVATDPKYRKMGLGKALHTSLKTISIFKINSFFLDYANKSIYHYKCVHFSN